MSQMRSAPPGSHPPGAAAERRALREARIERRTVAMAGEGRSDSGWVRLGLSRVAAAVQRFQAASVLWARVAVVVMGLPATAPTGATGARVAGASGGAITTAARERALRPRRGRER